MRPLTLTLQNVHSFRGEHTIDFRDVSLAVLTGPNGSGKSTAAVDAMRFALFGATRGPLDSIITESEQACRVEFQFALGDEVYLVSRQRSRKGAGSTLLSFQLLTPEGAVVLDGKSVAETQARIEQTLHLTDALFTVTACANQGNVAAFSHAKPAERKQVLSDILDLAAWERRAELARQFGRDLTAQVAGAEEQLARAEHQAAEAEGLRAQVAQGESARAGITTALASHEASIAAALQTKEQLVREEGEDRARRQELTDLAGRLTRAKASLSDASARRSGSQCRRRQRGYRQI